MHNYVAEALTLSLFPCRLQVQCVKKPWLKVNLHNVTKTYVTKACTLETLAGLMFPRSADKRLLTLQLAMNYMFFLAPNSPIKGQNKLSI